MVVQRDKRCCQREGAKHVLRGREQACDLFKFLSKVSHITKAHDDIRAMRKNLKTSNDANHASIVIELELARAKPLERRSCVEVWQIAEPAR